MFNLFGSSKRAEFATLLDELEELDERSHAGVFLASSETARRTEIEARLVALASEPVSPDERRKAVRIVCDAAVRVRARGGTGTGSLVDVGRGGAFIQTAIAAPIGETVQLSLVGDAPGVEKDAWVSARVCWAGTPARPGAPSGFGVAFCADTPGEESLARGFLLAIIRAEWADSKGRPGSL